MALKIEGKKCTPSLFSHGAIGQFTTSKWWGLTSMHKANTYPCPHNCNL